MDVISPEEKREAWVAGSIPQLRRYWGGRCITCGSWSPPIGKSGLGDCAWIPSAESAESITVASGAVHTAAAYGCVGWSEIAPEVVRDADGAAVKIIDADGNETVQLANVEEAHAAIESRTEAAIAVGLLDDVPDE